MNGDNIVGWMHPSWRDLVIERLSGDASAREHFLSRCGMHGFLLALSSAGGAKGQRSTPLLVSPPDWDALGETAIRLIKLCDAYSTWIVLTALHEAILHDVKTRMTNATALDSCLGGLARRCLHACVERWASDGPDQQSRSIGLFFSISEFLDPLPPSPNLKAIWECQVEAARTEAETFDPNEADLYCSALTDWLELAAIISANEPRLLRQVGFPDQFVEIAQLFLSHFDERARLDFDPSEPDECDTEEGHLTKMLEIVDSMKVLFPSLSKAISRTRRRIDDEVCQIQRERDDLEERESLDREDDDEDADDGGTEAAKRNLPPARTSTHLASRPIDLSKLFEDL